MAETLGSLAKKIDALAKTFGGRFDAIDKRLDGVDKRFDAVDRRFDGVDERFDGLRSELLVRIEAVDTKVDLVLEQMRHLVPRDVANSLAHARLEARLDDHDPPITALEGRNAGSRDAPVTGKSSESAPTVNRGAAARLSDGRFMSQFVTPAEFGLTVRHYLGAPAGSPALDVRI